MSISPQIFPQGAFVTVPSLCFCTVILAERLRLQPCLDDLEPASLSRGSGRESDKHDIPFAFRGCRLFVEGNTDLHLATVGEILRPAAGAAAIRSRDPILPHFVLEAPVKPRESLPESQSQYSTGTVGATPAFHPDADRFPAGSAGQSGSDWLDIRSIFRAIAAVAVVPLPPVIVMFLAIPANPQNRIHEPLSVTHARPGPGFQAPYPPHGRQIHRIGVRGFPWLISIRIHGDTRGHPAVIKAFLFL